MKALSRSRIPSLALLLLGATSILAGAPAATSDQPPRALATVQPIRPRPVFNVGASGVVEVKFTITADGTVADASVHRSTDVLLETAALDAIRKWKFSPAIKNGQPVAVRAMQSFTFDSQYAQRGPDEGKPAAKPAPKPAIAAAK